MDVTFLDVLVRQNDLVYTKIQLFMCFLRSKIFTFSKNVAYIYFEEKRQKKMKEEQITEGRKRTITFLCSKTSEVLKEKAFFIDKSKWRLKATKWWFHSGTLKAVDVTFLDILVRQNDLVSTKIQLFMCFLRSKIFTFSKMLLTSSLKKKDFKKWKRNKLQKEERQ